MNKSASSHHIAIIVYDNNRSNLIEWLYFNKARLCRHHMVANESLAAIVAGTLNIPVTALPEDRFGNYSALTESINAGAINMLICIGDPSKASLTAEALIKLAVEKKLIVAPNEASAESFLAIPEEQESDDHQTPHYDDSHQQRGYMIN